MCSGERALPPQVLVSAFRVREAVVLEMLSVVPIAGSSRGTAEAQVSGVVTLTWRLKKPASPAPLPSMAMA